LIQLVEHEQRLTPPHMCSHCLYNICN